MPKSSEKVATNPVNWLMSATLLLVVIALLIGFFAPQIPNSTKTIFSGVNPLQLKQAFALGLVAAATVIFLAYFRARFSFSTRWLVTAITYNVLIIFVKFTLSTNEYRGAVRFSSVLSTALLVSCLYLFAFAVLYLFFDGRILSRSLHKTLITTTDGKVLLAMGLFVCVTLARIIVFRLPVLSNTAAASYLGDVFKANTAILSALLFVMILAAVEAYAQVRRRADLKYFFTSGVALILLFHVAWAVFVFKGLK